MLKTPAPRQRLSADAPFRNIHHTFPHVPDPRPADTQGGRARWKIETFNILKNQGCHFEHNYGHGEQNLPVMLAMVMVLALLVDQTQQLC